MKKWLGRIIEGLVCAALSFVIISIVTKLMIGHDDWLYRSVTLSAPWGLVTLLKYYLVVDKKWKQLRFVVTIVLTTLTVTLFVTGVCLSLPDYWDYTSHITYGFAYPACLLQINTKK